MKINKVYNFFFLLFLFLNIINLNCQSEVKDNPNSKTTLPEKTGMIIDHNVVTLLKNGKIPPSAIENAKKLLKIGYGHTSHGSQLTDGMKGLINFANGGNLNGSYTYVKDLFKFNATGANGEMYLFEGSGYDESGWLALDCGRPEWPQRTRDFLNKHPDGKKINVIIWSWCYQVNDKNEKSMVTDYLEPMSQLEKEFPQVKFVYMTGHLASNGINKNINVRNNQIREYCKVNKKWLYDFADIESFDPDGNGDYSQKMGTDGCNYDFNNDGKLEIDNANPPVATGADKNWAILWQNSHTDGKDWYTCSSAHSQSLNANLKAYAAWYLWCCLAGWNGK